MTAAEFARSLNYSVLVARSRHPPQPSRPPGEASGPADALHGLIALVLFVVAVWPAGAHGSAGRVDDATAPMRAPQARRLAAVQIAFGEQWGGHAGRLSTCLAPGYRQSDARGLQPEARLSGSASRVQERYCHQ